MNVHSAFFPQRRHRGTTEATEATEEKTRCLFPERSQRRRFFFADVQDPPLQKKAKRKASDTRPPHINYSAMNEQELFFAMMERQKPDFDQAYNPLPFN